ncbi:EamA family transporter [Xylophilus ampelinus]|uniref:EamA-like transporter family protein n=1 Tax=Xylophilus ampelinus TaxID=54067 RepID=A0A318SGJ3_9BURK|nr:EamA family transporter [Xylophilus ampelinus]MCS4510498.1 EamA family transporter [Xylophilus ampelinus]PYE77954.1 EamA-like transporter family protein [Xylophilus ampelinus]
MASDLSPLVVVLWVLNVLVDSGGQLAFKAAAGDPRAGDGLNRWKWMARRPWLWIGIGCYVAEFLLWLAFLSLVPLSEGVLLGSINIVAIMVAGRFLFAEKLSRMRVAGILLVSIGVAVVGVH